MRTRLTILLLAVALLATAFVPAASADAPAPVTDLRIQSAGGAAITLAWTHRDATVVRYEIWRSDQPYAAVGDAGMVKLATVDAGALNEEMTYPDTFSAVGQTTLNVFYAVRGINGSGQASALSNRVGEFDFRVESAAAPPPTPTVTPTPTRTPTATPTAFRSPTPELTGTPTPTTEPREGVVAVPATISANTTWISGTVYLVTGQATLNAGVTLTIQGGAVVKFQNNGSTRGKLIVNGVLLAQGTAGAGVVFTSIHDDAYGGDTNNNGGATWPAAGAWDGLAFGVTSGGSALDYALVAYGGADGNVIVTGAAVTVRHATIRDGSSNGLRWLNGAGGEISDTTIQQNLSNGLYLSAASSPAVTGNTFRDNRGYAVYLEANCFPALGGNAVFGNGTNGAGVYGTVGTGTWYANDGLPYVATANLTIEAANTLTIQPGTVMKFLPNTTLIVRGAMRAVGTGSLSAVETAATDTKSASADSAQSPQGDFASVAATSSRPTSLQAAVPIVFTSLRDDAYGGDTQGDGPATKPAAGDWGTLYFADTSNDATTVLDYAIVRYAGAGYNYGSGTATAGISLDSASPTLDHLTVELSSAYGLQLLNASSPSLRRSTIQDNASHGLWLSASSGPAVSENRFLRNAGYAVYLGGASQAVFSGNAAGGNAVNGIGLAGSISSDTTWEADLPYVIADNATLEINTTLTIQPGVVVKLAAGKKWTVNGNLRAEATADQPIIFTSLKDDTAGGDTNGNANASYPAAGDWESLTFTQTSGGSQLSHVHFRYGGSNSGTGAVAFDNGAPSMTEHLTIMAAKYRGVYANNASPYLSGLRLTGNQVGLYNSASAYAMIQTSAIYSNTQYGVQNANTAYTLAATENWWGSHTGPTHASNPGGTGDAVSSYVDFSGFAAVSPMPLPDPLPPASAPPTWTTVSSNITANTTWYTSSSPYVVTADIAVNAGVKLTIQPGVIVKFAAGTKLTVNGMLAATGNAGQRIIFTSLKDDVGGDANGDGTASSPRPGDWGGITFADSSVDSQTKLQFATVRYAGSGGFGVLADAASPTISDSQINDNTNYGLLLRNYAAPPISRNWLLDNRGGGIKLETTSSPALSDNQLWGNGGYAVYMDATCYPSLTGNVAYYNWRNAVRVAGTVSFNQTWYANLDYVVEGVLTINAGAALTIQPGAAVKLNDTGSGIAVNGALIANGTASQRIVFTSVWDAELGHDVLNLLAAQNEKRKTQTPSGANTPNDGSTLSGAPLSLGGAQSKGAAEAMTAPHPSTPATNTVASAQDAHRNVQDAFAGGGGEAERRMAVAASFVVRPSSFVPEDAYWPAAGDWGRIAYADSSDDTKNVLNYVVVRYAGYSVNHALYANSAAPAITNSEIAFNTGHGLYLENQANPLIENDAFTRNSLSGIYLTNSSSPTIRNTTFAHHGAYAIETTAESKPVLIGNTAIDNAYNAVKVTGTIAGNTTWVANLTYVAGNVTIPAGASLTLNPGVVVKFLSGANWTVNGPVVVEGTDVMPIILTSLKDDAYGGDTNNDGGANLPQAGDWGGLTIANTASASRFRYAVIRYGGDPTIKVYQSSLTVTDSILDTNRRALWYDGSTGIITATKFLSNTEYAIYESSSALTVREDEFRWNRRGIYLPTAGAGPLVIQNNTFEGNWGYALSTDPTGFFLLDGTNRFSGNGGNAVIVAGSFTLTQDWPLYTGVVYRFDSVTVQTGVTLTVQPGVVVKFADYSTMLSVLGTLDVQGTAANPVVFTSWKDDTYGGDSNGDGSATLPAKGDWRYIKMAGNGHLTLDHAIVRYGGYWSGSYDGCYYSSVQGSYYRAAICGYASTSTSEAVGLSISDSIIEESFSDGISVKDDNATQRSSVSITNSTVRNNTTGVFVNGSVNAVTLADSAFTANSSGANIGSSAAVIATHNLFANHTATGLQISSPNATITDNTFSTNASNTASGLIVGGGAIQATGNTFNNTIGWHAQFSPSGAITLAANSYTGNAKLYFSGTAQNSTFDFDAATSVYALGDFSIDANSSLTVQPGVVVKFQYYWSQLSVLGILDVQGTAANPVVFTSWKDDTYGGDSNGDGSATLPAKGDWRYIKMAGNGHLTLDHAIVRYGGYWSGSYDGCYYSSVQGSYYRAAICGYASTSTSEAVGLSISDSIIEESFSDGISVKDDNATQRSSVSITNSTVRNNTGNGIYLGGYQSNSSSVHSSNIYVNSGYGIYNGATSIVLNAENNWWGTDSGPYHPTLNPGGTGNRVSDYVDFIPWLGQQVYYGQSVPNVVYKGDPVNTANGNYAYQRSDLSIPTRGLPLEFVRAYNSLAPEAGPLGYGWRHGWQVSAQETASDVRITYGDGRQIRFTPGEGGYVGDAGVFATLVKSGGVFHLTEKDQTVYHFDSQGRLASVEDKNGATTTLSYDGQGRLATVTEPAGRALTFAYTSPVSTTLISQVTDHALRTTQYAYDSAANLTRVTDVTGQDVAYTYDANHRLLTSTDANSHTFVRNVYNANGRVSEQYNGLNNRWTFAYDEPNHKTVVTDPLGRVATYQYDALLRLTSEKDALNQTASYAYDAVNNRVQVTDRRGGVARYGYDARSNTTAITDALGSLSSFTYDARNNLLSETDPLSRTTTYEYDSRPNLTRRTDALGNVATYAYDALGQLIGVTDPAARPTVTTPTATGRPSPTRWATSRPSPTTRSAAS